MSHSRFSGFRRIQPQLARLEVQPKKKAKRLRSICAGGLLCFSAVAQLRLSLDLCLHIKPAATFQVSLIFFFFLLLVFLPTLPNGLMERGCIGGSQVCVCVCRWGGDSCVLIGGLCKDV